MSTPKNPNDDGLRWYLLIGVAPLIAVLLAFIVISTSNSTSKRQGLQACLEKNKGGLEWKSGVLRATGSHYFLILPDGQWGVLVPQCNGRMAYQCSIANDHFVSRLKSQLGNAVDVGFCDVYPVQIELNGERRWMPKTRGVGRLVE